MVRGMVLLIASACVAAVLTGIFLVYLHRNPDKREKMDTAIDQLDRTRQVIQDTYESFPGPDLWIDPGLEDDSPVERRAADRDAPASRTEEAPPPRAERPAPEPTQARVARLEELPTRIDNTRRASRSAAPPAARPAARKLYTVRRGDSLYRIAGRELGSAERWPSIARANGLSAPYMLKPGQRLKLP